MGETHYYLHLNAVFPPLSLYFFATGHGTVKEECNPDRQERLCESVKRTRRQPSDGAFPCFCWVLAVGRWCAHKHLALARRGESDKRVWCRCERLLNNRSPKGRAKSWKESFKVKTSPLPRLKWGAEFVLEVCHQRNPHWTCGSDFFLFNDPCIIPALLLLSPCVTTEEIQSSAIN